MSQKLTRPLVCLATRQYSYEFPAVDFALEEPNGLLAAGGDLNVGTLIEAYSRGIFPWYEQGQPVLWWSPNPRVIIYPEQVKISRSLRKVIKKGVFTVTVDQNFPDVMAACAAPRIDQAGTWIQPEMINAYCELHEAGLAHSVECWRESTLVGGLYGVSVGKIFFGESMFSRESNTSKICLVYLAKHLLQWGYKLIDCQVQSEHLFRMGAALIPRGEFSELLSHWCFVSTGRDAWKQ